MELDQNATVEEILEKILDTIGPVQMADKLALISKAKAEHATETWQDKALAREWIKAARRYDIASEAIKKNTLFDHIYKTP